MSIALLGVFFAVVRAGRPEKPNIVFILADDMGYGDVGYLSTLPKGNSRRLLTPELDKLASQGMRFSDAYAGAPVCAPSRCTLMTGKHSGHCTVRSNGPILSKDDIGVASVLKKAGYKTALVGKWGLGGVNSTGSPMKKGFDEFYGQTDQAACHNYYPYVMWRGDKEEDVPENYLASDLSCGHDREKCSWSGDLWTKEAIDFMNRTQEDPFFLFLSYTAPHAGSVGNNMEVGEPVPRISKSPYNNKRKDWGGEVEYAAAVTEIDRQVGIVVDAIDKMNLTDSTLILFASDNGASNEGGHSYLFFNSSGPLKGFKRCLHEGGIRSAMIARWPGNIRPNSTSGHQATFYDFLPTAAEAAGLSSDDLPIGIDGISFLSALVTEKQSQRPFVYHEYCNPTEQRNGWGQAVRVGDWSAVCTGSKPTSNASIPVCKQPLLYNLAKDIHQDDDVSDKYPEIVKNMINIMKEQHTPGSYCGCAQLRSRHGENLDRVLQEMRVNFEDESDWELEACEVAPN